MARRRRQNKGGNLSHQHDILDGKAQIFRVAQSIEVLIKDHWYPMCPATRLGSDQPLAAQIGEYKLVAFRDENGTAVVMLDRCPHRGVPLSLGRVSDGKISCRYHGWEIAPSGNLVSVPAHPDQAIPKCAVPKFNAVEAYHYIWVWIAGNHETPTHQPYLRGIQSGEWMQWSCVWEVNTIAAIENNLDAAHVPFSHCLLYTSPSPRDVEESRMPSSA